MIKQNIILASQSPRRKWLLEGMGFNFDVKIKDVDESFPDELDCKEVAEFIAKKKATAFEDHLTENNIVITADTVVIHQNTILGKPKTFAEAEAMLQKLSDDEHVVITGVCVMSKQKLVSFSDESTVRINKISPIEMKYYIENFSPLDKAGAYGIQEWFGHNKVASIIGSYTNIMGLPTAKLYDELIKF